MGFSDLIEISETFFKMFITANNTNSLKLIKLINQDDLFSGLNFPSSSQATTPLQPTSGN